MKKTTIRVSVKLFLPCFSSFPILVKHSAIVCKILSLDILQISIALCFTRIGKEEEQGRKSFPLTLMVFLFHESEAFLISLCCSGVLSMYEIKVLEENFCYAVTM